MLTHNRTPLVPKAEIKFSIPGISTKSNDSETSLKTLTLTELDKSYGGCGIYIRQLNKPPITIAIPGGDMCSNYRAEAQALLTATETVTQLETRPKKVVLLTDSICSATTRIRKSRRLHLTNCNTKFKQPDINNSRTLMDTCTYRHTWKRSGRSAGERGKQEAAAKVQS